ncbi:MAG: hypothetical protein KF690_07155 [Bacteroidetes bacterium]|nr:hypothetical protein [Bacteroidota bacterium]
MNIVFLLEVSPTTLGVVALAVAVILYIFWQKLGKKSGEMDMQREVLRALAAGRYGLALQQARELEQQYPHNLKVQEIKIMAMIAEGNLPQALREADRVLAEKPGQRGIYRLKFWAGLLLADYAQAEDSLEKSYKGQQNHPMARIYRGVMMAMKGDAAEARRILTPLLRQTVKPMAPRNPFAPKKNARNSPEMQPQERTLIPPQVSPDDLPELGLAYYLIGERELAMQLWKQVFDANDKGLLNTRALLYRANVQLLEHHYQSALDDLALLQNIMPNNPQMHYLLYGIHRRLNNKDTAEYHLSKAIALGHILAGTGRDADQVQLFASPDITSSATYDDSSV